MVPDAECIKIIVEILDKLDLGQYKVYVSVFENHFMAKEIKRNYSILTGGPKFSLW